MKVKLTKLWGIFTGILVIGIIVYFAMLWVTSQNISAKVEEISSAKYSIAENKLEVCFLITVNNTGIIDVSIEKLYYKIYVQGEYLGEGSKEDIVINRGVNRINLCLKAPPSSALKAVILPILNKGKVNVTIKGYIDIPIKSFGVIKMWTLEIPYEKTVQVNLVSAGKSQSGPGPFPY